MPGNNWRLTIKEQIEAVDSVLVFWSKEAVEIERDIFFFEVDYARILGKCVQVIIDDLDPARIPVAFRHDQILHISPNAELLATDPTFLDVVASLLEITKRRLLNKDRLGGLELVSASLDETSSHYTYSDGQIIANRSDLERKMD